MGRRSNDEMKKRIGGNLLKFREQAGLSQQQVAERLGLSVSTLSKIEQGHNGPSQTTLIKLAELFGRDPSHFYMAEPPPAVPRDQEFWLTKLAPGATVDDDLQSRLDRFLRDLNREQLKRLREKRGLPPRK